MILGLGCIAYDQMLFTEATWSEGKGRISKKEFRFGGNVRNSLGVAAALGKPCAYLGTLSPDPQWEFVVSDLQDTGISTTFTQFLEGSHPAIATVVITRTGDRYIAYEDESLKVLSLPSSEKVASALAQTKILLVDGNTAPLGSLDVAVRANAEGIPIIYDLERSATHPGEALAMLDIASDPVLPLYFGQEITGNNSPEEIIASLWNFSRNAIVLTDGENGSYFRTGTDPHIHHIPAFPIEARDTNGLGDIFHGAYAVARLEGSSTLDCVNYATAAAASIAAREVGTGRKLTADGINKYLKSR